ncbi:siderophore ABC transporter substrate-binding protein [Alkalibacillus almallahensis]|uniref:siderophore ABC transporter substrate-binding protein n=1 Tax=Alkalibacillus almallahensis TaxID=1379154 RepID=UPI0014214485|nr:siderophore ABC transporter substrate-binding protein [Alkalibacillus almallahensis]NIK12080.1 iron complex transport system substrate-binding protein [Alkalibacillus almallahensis]
MKRFVLLLTLGVIALFLTACGSADAEEGDNSSETVTIEHELGTAEVDKNPENVVVFDFGMLDMLDAFDLPVQGVPQDSLPDYLSDYGSEDYENAGGLKEPDFEAVNAMDPDMIIISGRQQDLYEDFAEIAPTVYVETDSENYVDSIAHNAKIIGDVFGVQDQVDQRISDIENQVSEVNDLASDSEETGLITLATGGKVSAYGSGSRFGMIHDALGVKPVDDSIETSTHGQNISFEYIVEQDPDHLFVIDRDKVVNGEAAAKETIENDLIKGTTAYQEDQIHYLDPQYWYLADGGLQAVENMIEEVHNALQ